MRDYPPRENSNREKESRLNHYRLEKGLTIKEVCDAVGIWPGEYSGFNNGTKAPIYMCNGDKNGGMKPAAARLSEFFQVTPEDLFPRYFCSIDAQTAKIESWDRNWIETKIITDEPSLEDVIGLRAQVRKAFRLLTPKEELALRMRFGFTKNGDCTLEEVADRLGVFRERVRQIEAKAFRKILATPSIWIPLKKYLTTD